MCVTYKTAKIFSSPQGPWILAYNHPSIHPSMFISQKSQIDIRYGTYAVEVMKIFFTVLYVSLRYWPYTLL